MDKLPMPRHPEQNAPQANLSPRPQPARGHLRKKISNRSNNRASTSGYRARAAGAVFSTQACNMQKPLFFSCPTHKNQSYSQSAQFGFTPHRTLARKINRQWRDSFK
jgi:hypothetical protein